MPNVGRRVIAGGMALVLTFGGVQLTYASNLQQQQQQQQQLQDNMKDLQGKIIWADKEKTNVLAEINRIDWDLTQASNDLAYLENRRLTVEQEIKAATQRLTETEERLDATNQTANKRLRSLYENGSVSYLDVLFNGTSFNDFLARFDLVKLLLKRDVELLKEVKRLRVQQAADKVRVEQTKAEIVSLETETAARQVTLASRQADRTQVVQSLEQQKEAWQAAYEQFEAESRQLEAEIRRMIEASKGQPSQGTGTFGWPVPGYYTFTDTYGWRDDPFGGSTGNFHGGVDIAAPSGTGIAAVDSGTVAQAEYSGGFGNMVLIDHGGGLFTLYAHASKLLVTKGQKVAKGETIAKVGSTGWSTGPHLHIEVRVNGERTDPMPYLP